MEIIAAINLVSTIIFFVAYGYQFFYYFIAVFHKPKAFLPGEEAPLHKYAVLISARNESRVISKLIESIGAQKYPKDLITTFVVADNCTDDTADLARAAGAVVYTRFNRKNVGKGYALNYLLSSIKKDYGEDAFDGFFVFDADNILEENFIAEMNKAFSEGHRIVMGYRNTKNFGDNWISSSFGLYLLRESRLLNNPRMILGTSCTLSGTGFLVSKEIFKKYDGWNWFRLTEDVEFALSNVADGEKIAYCDSAVFYDEQTTSFVQSCQQRMRWDRGCISVFFGLFGKLFKGIGRKKGGFACFDLLVSIAPCYIVSTPVLMINLAAIAAGFFTNGDVSIVLWSAFQTFMAAYLTFFWVGALLLITEWKRILCLGWKKILSIFAFPFFYILYMPVAFFALFKRRIEWVPIIHRKSVSLDEVRRTSGTVQYNY